MLESTSHRILHHGHPKPPAMASSDSTIYTCTECRANLNLTAANLYPPDFFFEAGNKGTVSFAAVDATKFRFDKEDKIRPFFETRNYWGIQWTRTKIKCNGCGRLVGYVYGDGPLMIDSPGQFHMGPSQVVPRAARYRFKTKALRVSSGT
nr:uncharacterized protein LOC114821792 [Malus domestica]